MCKCLYLLGFVLVLVACGEEASEEELAVEEPTPGFVRNNEGSPTWTYEVLEGGDVGLHPVLASGSGGTLGAAWFAASSVSEGACEDLEGMPARKLWSLKYASLEDGVWSVEEVAAPGFLGEPPGLSLVLGAGDVPMIASMAGESVTALRFCGAHDAAVYTRGASGAWTVETAARSSGDAATGDPASDFGEVVGYWPALGMLGADPVLAYKDVHAGSIQSDDQRRADLEIAIREGGAWTQLPVDPGTSAGDFTDLLVDARGTLFLAYVRPFERTGEANQGLWVARSEDRGRTWEFVQLFPAPTPNGPSLVMTPEGLAVLFYNSVRGYPQLARLEDEAQFGSVDAGWTLEDIGEGGFDEGYTASLRVTPAGQLVAAWYRCNRAEAGLGECAPESDALVLAWESGDAWRHEIVDTGDNLSCGTQPSLQVVQGRAHVLYDCEVEGDVGVERQVKLAVRKVLP